VLSDCVEDDVVRLAVLGEIFGRVVDDLASWTAAVPMDPDAP
jgi:hypothetical protein